MTDKPDAGEPYFTLYGGLKVKVSDMIPDGAAFGFEQSPGRVQWFGLDPGAPEGDQTVYHLNPSFRIDKSLLDGIGPDELLAAERVSLELEAMRRAADLFELGERLLFPNTTTAERRWPEHGRPFRMEDMTRIMDDMERKRHDANLKLVEALIGGGFTVTVNDVTTRPVAVLPPEYQAALDEVLRDRDNRDPAENAYRAWGLWPERFLVDDLSDDLDMDPAEYRKWFENDWSGRDEQDIGG